MKAEDQDRIHHGAHEGANRVAFIAGLPSPIHRSSVDQHIPAASSGRNGEGTVRRLSARLPVAVLTPRIFRIVRARQRYHHVAQADLCGSSG
jgi:hypothetical protein